MKVGSETDIRKSVKSAVGGAHNAVRLSSRRLRSALFANGRTTVRRPLTDAAVRNRRAEESQAR